MLSSQRGLAALLIPRLPFFYGWVILACVCCAGFRAAGAGGRHALDLRRADDERVRLVAHGFVGRGLARRDLGGVASPLIGPMLDRQGARLMLCAAVLVTSAADHAAVADAVAAGLLHAVLHRPHELRRPPSTSASTARSTAGSSRAARFVTAIANLAQMAGLVVLPLHRASRHAAPMAGARAGWRSAPRC